MIFVSFRHAGISVGLCVALSAAAAGCGSDGEPAAAAESPAAHDSDLSLGVSIRLGEKSGAFLFGHETFGGNGRTCTTCHRGDTGTITPEQIQRRFRANPRDPLFRAIDSDDGTGQSYTRLLTTATFAVRIPLPRTVRLHDDPDATEVTLFRGVPTTFDTPALDPVLMSDRRAPDLVAQALGAIHGHAEGTIEPTAAELGKIAAFEKTLFSSDEMRRFAEHPEAPPELPLGRTESEQRGREFFLPEGRCGHCHGGPLLNTHTKTNEREDFIQTAFLEPFGGPPPPVQPNPPRAWDLECPPPPATSFVCDNPGDFKFVKNGNVVTGFAPDPGILLTTGLIDDMQDFKIPILRSISKTAPYFHDNTARTLEEVVEHYDGLFVFFGFDGKPGMTPQQKADIVAYMKLL